MKKLDDYLDWIEDRQDLLFELIRIYLGIALFVRGLYFFLPAGRELLVGFLDTLGTTGWLSSVLWGHYIILAHLVGGFFLTIGLLTRLAALLQIPILVGAVFFVHIQEGLFTLGQSLELAALVLFLLVIVLVRGPGVWSLDHHLLHKTMGLPEHGHSHPPAHPAD
ncbi:MAG: DoxX family protein [Opitutales bacterium]